MILTADKGLGTVIPSGPPWPIAMAQTYETTGRVTMTSLAAKQPHELLLQLGGVLAVLLSIVLYAIQWSQGIPASQLSGATMTIVVNVVLGGALWVSSAIVRKNLINGAIVAGVVSVILIAFGGQAGTIGGVVGILGAVVAAASPYAPWSRRG